MPSRYQNSALITNSKKIESDGTERYVRRLETTFYPNFDEIFENDTYILSQENDRLDILAKEFYGDEVFWHVIAKANGLGHGTVMIPPGRIIRIPFYNDYASVAEIIYQRNRER